MNFKLLLTREINTILTVIVETSFRTESLEMQISAEKEESRQTTGCEEKREHENRGKAEGRKVNPRKRKPNIKCHSIQQTSGSQSKALKREWH